MASGPESDQLYREYVTRRLETSFVSLVEALDITTSFEIGAHEASFSMEIASKIENANCYAFEANPIVFEKYEKEVEESGVVYLNQAISEKASNTVFHVPIKDNGKYAKTLGSLSRDKNYKNFKEYEVHTTSLNKFKEKVPESCVLWIDVEGHAGEVVEGALEILCVTEAIYIEMETRQRWEEQKTDLQIMEILLPLGFVPILRDVQRFEWQYNAIFVHHSKLHKEPVKKIIEHWQEEMLLGSIGKLYSEID